MNAIEKLTNAADLAEQLAAATAVIEADIAHQEAKGQYFTGSLAADSHTAAVPLEDRQAMRRERYYATRQHHADLLKAWKANR